MDRLLKESRLEEIKSASPGVIDAALGPVDPGLQATKQRLAQLKADYSSLAQTYGAAYPRVMTLKAQIEQLQREQSEEEKAQISRAEKELEASRSNEAKLRAALDQKEQDAFGKGEKAMEMNLPARITKQIACFTTV